MHPDDSPPANAIPLAEAADPSLLEALQQAREQVEIARRENFCSVAVGANKPHDERAANYALANKIAKMHYELALIETRMNVLTLWSQGKIQVWGRLGSVWGKWIALPRDAPRSIDPEDIRWDDAIIIHPNPDKTLYCVVAAPVTTVDAVSADRLNGRGRRRNVHGDAALKNKLETVIKNAAQSWPDKQKRPPITTMAEDLIRRKKAADYQGDTLRKILSGTYEPAKRLGISPDW